MELTNSLQEHHTSPLRVAPLGFEGDIVEKLEKIFQRERPNQRVYSVVYPFNGESVDILLVNYDLPSAVDEKKRYSTIPFIAASQNALSDDSITYRLHPYQVHGILLAARILNILDKVNHEQTNETSASKPAVDVTEQKTIDYRVLVVDDSVSIQKSLELNLRTLQNIQEIDFADSGEEALEKVEAKHYDIIFLDVMMPGIDGYETCTQIRKMPNYKQTPIVMVSAKSSPLDEVKGIIAGCTTYLTKPVQNEAFQKLSYRLMEWLANKKTV